MASFMKNSELHQLREQIRIKYGNMPFLQWGELKSLNEYPEYIYKEIGREVNIVIRYIEDLDVVFSETEEFTEWHKTDTLIYLNNLFSSSIDPIPTQLIKDTYYLVSTLTEIKAWYKRLNSNLDTLLENVKK